MIARAIAFIAFFLLLLMALTFIGRDRTPLAVEPVSPASCQKLPNPCDTIKCVPKFDTKEIT